MATSGFTEANFKALHTKLSEWWETVRNLKTDSPPEDWEMFASYLSPNCVLYLGGMGSKATHGRDGAIESLKTLLTYWKIKERKVISMGMDLSGRVVTASMKNPLVILGQDIELDETEVVTFDDEDLILGYKLYCDPKDIMAIFQKANTEGS